MDWTLTHKMKFAHRRKRVHFWTKLTAPSCLEHQETPKMTIFFAKIQHTQRKLGLQIPSRSSPLAHGFLSASTQPNCFFSAGFTPFQVAKTCPLTFWHLRSFVWPYLGSGWAKTNPDSVGSLFVLSHTLFTAKPISFSAFPTCAWDLVSTMWSRPGLVLSLNDDFVQ